MWLQSQGSSENESEDNLRSGADSSQQSQEQQRLTWYPRVAISQQTLGESVMTVHNRKDVIWVLEGETTDTCPVQGSH